MVCVMITVIMFMSAIKAVFLGESCVEPSSVGHFMFYMEDLGRVTKRGGGGVNAVGSSQIFH